MAPRRRRRKGNMPDKFDQHGQDVPRRPSGGWGAPPARTRDAWKADEPFVGQPTQNLNILRTRTLIYPRQIKRELPMTAASHRTVVESREVVKAILSGTDQRLLAIVGPCSIHDEHAAMEYAARLRKLADEVRDRIAIVMRVYFEKPRTTIGWKGLINDPHLDGSFDMETGLRLARKILLQITALGLPTGTEALDPITPQYIADLLTWAAIGARTTESQTHRTMASGLSMPVGFKNGTDGSLQVALDALAAVKHRQAFLGIDENGLTAVIETKGNPWGHIILRGGRDGPNYHPDQVAAAILALEKAGLPHGVMVDCSHANADKKFYNQKLVLRSVVEQRVAGARAIIGVMLESNLVEGNQQLGADKRQLRYGVSITDECIGWEETEVLLRETYASLGTP
jgi:3-deoxy-7-phosphoheptulonate synthase